MVEVLACDDLDAAVTGKARFSPTVAARCALLPEEEEEPPPIAAGYPLLLEGCPTIAARCVLLLEGSAW